MVWVSAFALGFFPAVLGLPGSPFAIRSIAFTTAWLSGLVLAWAVYFRFKLIFPPFELRIRAEERWIRKFATEITVLAAVISAVAAIIALVQKGK
jgi:hypothetical protein